MLVDVSIKSCQLVRKCQVLNAFEYPLKVTRAIRTPIVDDLSHVLITMESLNAGMTEKVCASAQLGKAEVIRVSKLSSLSSDVVERERQGS